MIDYAAAAEKARLKMMQYGRPIKVQTRGKTPIDTEKPWKGSDDVDISYDCWGVFVPPNQVRIFGLSALGQASQLEDMWSTSEQVVITYLPTEISLTELNYIEDSDGSEWSITATQELRPGEIRILTYLGTRR